MGDLGEGIVLVHELGQLTGAEELLDHRRHRFGVDQLLRHQLLGFREAQAFLYRPLDPHEPDPELVLRHLADAANAPVAQVVDVVDGTTAVLDVDQRLECVDDVRPLAVFEDEVDERLVVATHAKCVERLVAGARASGGSDPR